MAWLAPGLVLAVVSRVLFERWRGTDLSFFGERLVFFLAFFLGIVIGNRLQDALR